MDDFAAFILTNGRPHNVKTYDTLRRCGYTGRIVILIDDLDPTSEQYKQKYGGEVVAFDKRAIAVKFDVGDNFNDMRAIIYARNASFEVARDLGITYFIQLDDDYNVFEYRFDGEFRYTWDRVGNLDALFGALVSYFESIPALSIAISQGGDWIGGGESSTAKSIKPKRKCMNSFICSVDRQFQFVGRVNEDVNTYTRLGSTGALFLTITNLSLVQTTTQSNPGGMSEMYRDTGTYIKTFYTVMYSPSCTKVSSTGIGEKNIRLHHNITWKNAVPVILRESVKKQ